MNDTERKKLEEELRQNNQEKYAEREAAFAKRMNERWPRFAHVNVFALDKDVSERIFDWGMDKPEGNLILLGPVGTGKTFAAFAYLYEAAVNGATWDFWPLTDLLEALRPNSGRDDDLMSRLFSVDFLAMDDLGSEKPSEWTTEKIYMIVNNRWMAKRPLIVTSNLSRVQLKSHLEPRTYSRLFDGATVVQIVGEDRRK